VDDVELSSEGLREQEGKKTRQARQRSRPGEMDVETEGEVELRVIWWFTL
jgi:hypothetical protein